VAPSFLDRKHTLFDMNLLTVIVLMFIVCVGLVDTGMQSTIEKNMAAASGQTAVNVPVPSVPEPMGPVTLPFSGNTAEGKSTGVDGGRLPAVACAINATLQWTDDYGSNDDFRLELLVNGTVEGMQEGTTGQLVVSIAGAFNGTLSARVTAVSCPGVVGISPIDRDSGNSWQLDIEISFGGQG
jgi:hypothetical protein